MSVTSAVMYLTSEYPERPRVIIWAQQPVDLDELRTHMTNLREGDFKGQQVTFEITAENMDTGELTHMPVLDPSVDINEIDFSAIS